MVDRLESVLELDLVTGVGGGDLQPPDAVKVQTLGWSGTSRPLRSIVHDKCRKDYKFGTPTTTSTCPRESKDNTLKKQSLFQALGTSPMTTSIPVETPDCLPHRGEQDLL